MGRILEAFRFHSQTLIQLLIEPGAFFRVLPEQGTAVRAWVFLGCCACFFSIASLLTIRVTAPLTAALVFIAQVVGFVMIGACMGYLTLIQLYGKKGSFFMVFCIYAFPSGITCLISWLPHMLWLTEPWRWWLTWTGFCLVCGLSKSQAFTLVFISAAFQWTLYYPLIQMLNQWQGA